MIIDNTNNWTESDMEFDGLVILNSLIVPNYIGLSAPDAGTVGLIKNGNQTGFYVYADGEYSLWTKDSLGDWSLLCAIDSTTELGDLSERLGETYSWDSHAAVYFQVNSSSLKLYTFPRAGALIVDSTPSDRSDSVNLLKFDSRSYISSAVSPKSNPSGVVVSRGGGNYWYENIADEKASSGLEGTAAPTMTMGSLASINADGELTLPSGYTTSGKDNSYLQLSDTNADTASDSWLDVGTSDFSYAISWNFTQGHPSDWSQPYSTLFAKRNPENPHEGNVFLVKEADTAGNLGGASAFRLFMQGLNGVQGIAEWTSPWVASTWYNIVVTFDRGTNQAELFVNGTSVGLKGFAVDFSPAAETTANVMLGQMWAGHTSSLTGKLKNFEIYNKKLSQEEISALNG